MAHAHTHVHTYTHTNNVPKKQFKMSVKFSWRLLLIEICGSRKTLRIDA